MRKTTITLLAGAALAAVASTAALAQPYGYTGSSRAPTATFYELPNFQGRSVSVDGEVRNLSGIGFNDKAMSARFDGTWTICEDSEFRSRCETVSGQVRDLSTYNLARRVSSARANDWNGGVVAPGYGGPGYGGPGYGTPGYGGPGYGGPGYDGPGYDGPGNGDDRPGGWGRNRGVEGRSVVFYAQPRMNDVPLWASGKQSADDFCRRMGHSSAVYYDITERASRSQDFTGRWFNNSAVLRDVLCRK